MIAASFVTHPTAPSKRIAALQASDRGAETPAGKTAKSTNGKFAAPQRFEKQRQKSRPSRWMPISTGTATSS
jgi:hypothetical protein